MGMPLAHLGLGPVQSRLDAIRRQVAESPGAAPVLQEAVEALSALIEELRAPGAPLSEGQALVAAERARYRKSFELAPDAYIITDTNGAITAANAVASRVLRTPADRLLGEPLAAFVAPSDELLFRARLAALQQSRTRNPVEWQLWLRPPGSSPFPVSVTVSAIVGNQPPQIRWLLRDITARHYAQRAAVESLRVAQDAYERERRITARFQNALLPRSDLLIPGCILAHSYRPALAEAEAEVIQAMYDAALHQSRGDIRDDIVLMALRRADTPYDAETLRVEPPQMARRQSLPAP